MKITQQQLRLIIKEELESLKEVETTGSINTDKLRYNAVKKLMEAYLEFGQVTDGGQIKVGDDAQVFACYNILGSLFRILGYKSSYVPGLEQYKQTDINYELNNLSENIKNLKQNQR
jgi:hypothetical protein